MAGLLPASKLTDVLDKGNMSFIEAGREAGYSMSSSPQDVLQAVHTRASKIGYFVELHIEQGAGIWSHAILRSADCLCYGARSYLRAIMSAGK